MYMEELPNGAKRKVKQVVVRKPTKNAPQRSFDDDYQIPLAAQDSQWSGISFRLPEFQTECTDNETEIRVFNLDEEEKLPLLLLFPDIKDDLRSNMSSTSLTKLLVGKEANIHLLKPSKKLPKQTINLATVSEDSESSASLGSLRFRILMSSENDIQTFNSDTDRSYWGDMSSQEDNKDGSLLKKEKNEAEENVHNDNAVTEDRKRTEDYSAALDEEKKETENQNEDPLLDEERNEADSQNEEHRLEAEKKEDAENTKKKVY